MLHITWKTDFVNFLTQNAGCLKYTYINIQAESCHQYALKMSLSQNTVIMLS